MIRCSMSVMLCACLIASVTAVAQTQTQSTQRPQVFVLEISIVERNGVGLEELEKMDGGDQLKRSIEQGKARLIAGLRVRTRIGESFSTRVGERVPIQTATMPTFQMPERNRRDQPGSSEPPVVAAGIPQIQYESTGLSIEGSSMAAPDGMLDVKLRLEMSGLDRSSGNLTPSFLQRSITNAVRLRGNETAMSMALTQQEPLLPALAQPSPVRNAPRTFVVLVAARPVQ